MVKATLKCISGLLGGDHKNMKKKKKQQQETVEFKVRVDCDCCERRIMKPLSSIKGVQSVEVNRKLQKVVVTGYVDVNKVLKKASESTGKKVEVWPSVPHSLVANTYIAGGYEKQTPPGYVRNVEATAISKQADQIASIFSDRQPKFLLCYVKLRSDACNLSAGLAPGSSLLIEVVNRHESVKSCSNQLYLAYCNKTELLGLITAET